MILGYLIFQISIYSNQKIYSNFLKTNAVNWSILDTLKFDFKIENKKQLCNFNILMRTNYHYEYSNLFLFIDLMIENQLIKRDTLNCVLYDAFGNPKNRNIGNTIFSKINYIDSITLQNNKNYSIKIIHGMRKNSLNGVEMIGLEINKN